MGRTLKDLLKLVVEKKASDLHVNAGVPPMMRIDGTLVPVDSKPLTADESQRICYECLNQEQIMRFDADRSIDLSFGVEGLSRFRANIYWSLDTVAGALRMVPYVIPPIETLGIPGPAISLADLPRGLVLVTGPTGSGKSTTLAALINLINEQKAHHIVTIEDPIEYLHTQKKSMINQIEVGRDTPSFGRALKHILRQDPNVVLIGEMRDFETVQSAISVAETGHLVFATLHTNTAVESIDRMIDVFPPHQQPQVRTQLSFILQGVICQQLLPKIGGGRALAAELMILNAAIRNIIREGKTHQILSHMQTGQQKTGMTTLDQSLAKLVMEGKVDRMEALGRCVNQEDFSKFASERG